MKSEYRKKKFNLAIIFFSLSSLIVFVYLTICFLPITSNAYVIENIVRVNSPSGGVAEVLVNTGAKIESSQSIILINPTQAQDNYQEYDKQQQQMVIELGLIEQQIRFLKIDLEIATTQLANSQNDLQVEKSKINLDSFVVNQLADTIKLQQLQVGKIKQQITLAQMQLDKTKLSLANLDNNKQQMLLASDKVVVKATANGIIKQLLIESSSMVTLGQPLYDFIDTSQVFIRAYFNENDLNKIKVGTSVLIIPRAYLGAKLFHGIVVNDRDMAINELNKQTNISAFTLINPPQQLPVLIRVIDADDEYRLISGMSAYVYVQGDK